MLHRIRGLFQKISCQKTGKSGENKSNSHGRTMTEMLGVLAIMGVLSIGALAGYRYAMDKYRANATMNDINLRGVDLVIQASRNIPLNLDEWSNTSTAGYTFGTPEHVADGFVKLPISGLPKRVCEMVVDGLSGQYDMDINGAQIGTGATCGDDNIITVYFDATGSAGTDNCGGCPGAQTCVDGACVCTNGGTGEDCEKDLCEGVSCGECQKCQNGTCVEKEDYSSCPSGHCESGKCVSYDYDEPELPRMLGSCNTSEDCENRCMYCEDGFCAPKKEGTACGENGVCHEVEGRVGCVYPCSADKPLKDYSGKCHSCDERSFISVGSADDCAVCPYRKIEGGLCLISECPADRPLMNPDGYCYSCDTAGSVPVIGKENCDVCSNRVLMGEFCILLGCPADKPLRDAAGTCHSCDTASSVYVYMESCSVCENRTLSDRYYCTLSECPADKPLRDEYGTCYSCYMTSDVSVSGVEESCAVCDNRKLDGSDCILSECPSGQPLRSSDGNCYSCDTIRGINDGGIDVTENCAVCPNRVLQGRNNDYCALPCSSDKPLMDYEGNCYSCDTMGNVSVWGVTENCAKCSNRKLDGNFCILK